MDSQRQQDKAKILLIFLFIFVLIAPIEHILNNFTTFHLLTIFIYFICYILLQHQ